MIRKVAFEIRIREFCSGCGVVMSVMYQSTPHPKFVRADILAHEAELALKKLEHFECPKCYTKTESVDFFFEARPQPAKPEEK